MEAVEKLKHDLTVLEAMAGAMDDYLRSEILFYPLRRGDLPQLTLGGYLMRQHRLLALRDLLNMQEQARLHEAINTFNEALQEKVVRFERKAHDELQARLRQWREYLQEVKQGQNIAYYDSAVDTRAMIKALIDQLRVPPYELDEEVPRAVGRLDRELSRIWDRGDFVWPTEWQPAYPRDSYWWLYGHPRPPKDKQQ
ncbi:MAG: hypothetical protein R3272_03785 [Candidatus Promineifilaceae bacterium]|nr:hypothetical protein [Candidatus Promineifilaceae bacterium]